MTKPIIRSINIIGDSLSDRGTMYEEELFDIIPMKYITGLEGNSPQGSFTNGYTWADHFCTTLINRFIIHDLEKNNKSKFNLRNSDIANNIIMHDKDTQKKLQKDYTLSNDRSVAYKGKLFVRTYTIGGLTSESYKGKLSISPARFFSRLILSNLEEQRKLLLEDDKKANLVNRNKKDTLTIEWSGGNDLITVNKKPSIKEANDAVNARIHNVKELIKNGYRHFVLFNLPDFTNTPRYKKKSQAENKLAKDVVIHFNRILQEQCEFLQKIYPHCSIQVFDIYSQFTTIYQNPEKYGFEKDKLDKPFIKSKDFHGIKNGVAPSSGYLYFDDIHPSSDAQMQLSDRIHQSISKAFTIKPPHSHDVEDLFEKKEVIDEEDLVAAFKVAYQKRKAKECFFFKECFFTAKSKLNMSALTLEGIFNHAYKDGAKTTRETLIDLGWINENDELLLETKPLEQSIQKVKMM